MTVDELRRNTGLPVVSADSGGYITAVSDAFCAAYAWRREDLVGKPLTTIIPPQFHDAHHLGFSRFLATGKPTILDRPLALDVVTGDGRSVAAEHRIAAERVAGAWTFAASIRPLDPAA